MKGEGVTKSGISSNSAQCVNGGLVGDQKFWLILTGFFRYPHDKSVKTLGQFLSANFSTSALSWKDKNISICRVHFQLFGHILILQILKSLWPCSLYDQMCENTPSVIVL